jgi:hypothetical protein
MSVAARTKLGPYEAVLRRQLRLRPKRWWSGDWIRTSDLPVPNRGVTTTFPNEFRDFLCQGSNRVAISSRPSPAMTDQFTKVVGTSVRQSVVRLRRPEVAAAGGDRRQRRPRPGPTAPSAAVRAKRRSHSKTACGAGTLARLQAQPLFVIWCILVQDGVI